MDHSADSAHGGDTASHSHASLPGAAVLDALPLPLWIGSGDGRPLYQNPAWLRCRQAPAPAQSATVHCLEALLGEVPEATAQQWRAGIASHAAFQMEMQLGDQVHRRWHRLDIAPCPTGQRLWQIVATDIHADVLARQALAASLHHHKRMLDVSADCIKALAPNGVLTHVNAFGCEALGVCRDSAIGHHWLELLPPAAHAAAQRAFARASQGKRARFAGMRVDGRQVQHWDHVITPVLDDRGSVESILWVSRDVTSQRQARLRMRAASEMDDLTGLPNRRSFKAHLARSIAQCSASDGYVGLMLVDLDHFKHVNDTLGHVAGDHLLRALSKRLRACLPPGGFVARLGGDEFAVVQTDLSHMDAFLDLADRIHQQIEAPVTYAGKVINGGMSIGCAMYPRDGHDLSSLLQCADTALNDIKAGGRGGIRMYSVRLMQIASRAAAQLERARRIVRESTIEPHYQPLVSLHDHRITGFEALLRWRDGSGRLQYPKRVAEAFKNYEVAARISTHMQQRVFADMATWLQQGLPVPPVAINAAPVEFLRGDYAERLLTRAFAHGIPAALIGVEVTEHSLTERNGEFVGRALRALKEAGVRIALDDFGTGHSSLSNLRDYPVDCIKIDGDFVRRMQQDPVIATIVKAVCELGPALQVDIVAEGVETLRQSTQLQEAGCSIGQGYLFSPALPPEAVRRLLAQRTPATIESAGAATLPPQQAQAGR